MFVGFIVLLRELLVHFVAVKSLINYNNCKNSEENVLQPIQLGGGNQTGNPQKPN